MRAAATLVLIGWGAIAFGAPYPWAYVPLFALCLAIGAAGFWRGPGSFAPLAILAVALGCVAVAIAIQLIPLSSNSIRAISPETDAFLQRYFFGYGTTRHALSIDPPSTALGLASFIALSVFALGSARWLTDTDARRIAVGVAVVGVVISVAGIVQAATWNGKLYGFWTPEQPGTAFGPFNNHNHFAGWMLMAIPLSVGYLNGRLATAWRHVKPDLRHRLLWLATPEASQVLLIGFAILVMATALVLTRSRSGLIGFLAAMSISAWSATRQPTTGVPSRAIVVCLLLVVVVAVTWTGIDRLASSFSTDKISTLGLRIPAWGDALRIARRFPLVGTGLNTYGVATLFYQTVDLSAHYGEAHNDYLQLAVEGGLLIGIPAVAALAIGASMIGKRVRDARDGRVDDWVRRGATTGIVAIALQETVDFSLQMPGNAVLLAVLIAIVVRSTSR